jgi:hypothetical protein
MGAMDEIIELENTVSGDGLCVLHLMSNFELAADAPALRKYNAPVDATIEIKNESGAYHLRATWPMRGALKVVAEGWPVPKVFVVWNLNGCGTVTRAMIDAANYYQDIFGERPGFAFIRKLPRGVENGVEVDDLMLFEADWMVRRCVAVGWRTTSEG